MNISFGTDHLTCFFQVYKKKINTEGGLILWFILFNATFNNILVISWRSAVFLVKESGVLGENHRPVASHWQTLSHNVVSSTSRHERGSNLQL